MGNQCCSKSDQEHSQSQKNLLNSKQQNRICYIDSQGNPLPNAYRTFVKPPTTVGRQTLVVRNLQENQEIPEWIWAFDDNIMESGHQKNNKRIVAPLTDRRSYQEVSRTPQHIKSQNITKTQHRKTYQTNPINYSQQINANTNFQPTQTLSSQSLQRTAPPLTPAYMNQQQVSENKSIQPLLKKTSSRQNLTPTGNPLSTNTIGHPFLNTPTGNPSSNTPNPSSQPHTQFPSFKQNNYPNNRQQIPTTNTIQQSSTTISNYYHHVPPIASNYGSVNNSFNVNSNNGDRRVVYV